MLNQDDQDYLKIIFDVIIRDEFVAEVIKNKDG